MKTTLTDNCKLRQFSLFCIIFQSIGIRFFDGLSIIIVCIMCILNFKNLNKLRTISHPTILFIIILLVLLLCAFKGFSLLSLCYLFAVTFCSILILLNYNNSKANFIQDITPVLWFYAWYGFISWMLLIIIPGVFTKVNHGLSYSTLFYIFINLANTNSIVPRLSSLFWEPGCCQFVLNFLLLILISKKANLSKILFIVFLVLATQSTTGYINLIILLVLYLKTNRKFIIPLSIGIGLLLSVGIYSMVSSNITTKFENTSGIIRSRDFYVGFNLILKHPILGEDTENLANNSEAQALEDEIWGRGIDWTSSNGYFAGGYTNGLLGVFLDYGVIIGLILYWFTLKAPIIWNNRRLMSPFFFFCIYFCSLIGEPISRTSLFFFFAFSFLVNHKLTIMSSKRISFYQSPYGTQSNNSRKNIKEKYG